MRNTTLVNLRSVFENEYLMGEKFVNINTLVKKALKEEYEFEKKKILNEFENKKNIKLMKEKFYDDKETLEFFYDNEEPSERFGITYMDEGFFDYSYDDNLERLVDENSTKYEHYYKKNPVLKNKKYKDHITDLTTVKYIKYKTVEMVKNDEIKFVENEFINFYMDAPVGPDGVTIFNTQFNNSKKFKKEKKTHTVKLKGMLDPRLLYASKEDDILRDEIMVLIQDNINYTLKSNIKIDVIIPYYVRKQLWSSPLDYFLSDEKCFSRLESQKQFFTESSYKEIKKRIKEVKERVDSKTGGNVGMESDEIDSR